MAKYTRSQVKIGDEVQFSNRYIEHTHYKWKVVAKLDNTILMVEINEPGISERRMIDIDDVIEVIPAKR
jgi:hypothetical protein